MEHERISQGPVTAEFEAAVATALGVPYAVAATSGSGALFLAALAAGIGPGDEVIVPDRTFIATAHAVMLLGARVVLVDTLPGVPLLDVSAVEAKITKRTKAVMPVHLNGRAVDMAGLNVLARQHGLTVIEDAAQAMFSRALDGYLGTLGTMGCFSLGMTKLVSTGQGGIVVTRDAALHERLKLLRNHGVVDTMDANYTMRGFNLKFTDIAASIGLAQLQRLPEKIAHVRRVHARYAAALSRLPFVRLIDVRIEDGEIPIWVELLCPERDRLMAFLGDHGIQARKFLPDLHTSPHIATGDRFPNSSVFAQWGMSLPAGPSQPLENVDLVIAALDSYVPFRKRGIEFAAG